MDQRAIPAGDRHEWAAKLLVNAFRTEVDKAVPEKSLSALAGDLAILIGISTRSSWYVTHRKEPDGTLIRVALDMAVCWERAGLAARRVAGEVSYVTLLPRADAVLRGHDTVGQITALLRQYDPWPTY